MVSGVQVQQEDKLNCLGFGASAWVGSLGHKDSPSVGRFRSSVMSDSLEDPKDCSPSGSSVNGILQTRTVEWKAEIQRPPLCGRIFPATLNRGACAGMGKICGCF